MLFYNIMFQDLYIKKLSTLKLVKLPASFVVPLGMLRRLRLESCKKDCEPEGGWE